MYRAFFALPKSIVDRRERPVNALLGTVNAMLAASEASRSRAVVACLGAEEAVYRVALYPGYHAHRDPMPPELADQWKRVPALLESFGWSVSGLRCSSCPRTASRWRSARRRFARATAWTPGWCPTSSPCAATPPTGC